MKGNTNGKQSVDKGNTNGKQSVDNFNQNTIAFNSLTGIQKNIIEFLYNSCLDNRSRITEKTNIIDIQKVLQISESSIKTSILRLKAKNVISIHSRKDGRGGWCKYELEKNLFFSAAKELQTVNNDEKLNPIYINNSNYYENNKETTLTEIKDNTWNEINISELQPFGFKKSHLDQIQKFNTVSAEETQDSINHYAWALHNRAEEMAKYAPEKNRFKGLFGVLRKGNAWVEDGYIDPVDEAINKSLEAKRKQLEKIKKQKEEAFNLDFEIWKESLEDSEWEKVKAKIKKETGRESGGMFDASLKKYFRENIKQGR